MNVLALVLSEKGISPGQRATVEMWERVLEPAGIRLHYVPFETPRLRKILYQPGGVANKAVEMLRAYGQRLRVLDDLEQFDAVYLYREAALLGPAFLEKRIARHKPIIYHLDEPLFVPYRSPANGYLSYLKFFGKFDEICRLSKVVIVNANQPLYDHARQLSRSVWQIPSLVDTDDYTFDPRQAEADDVCVGWSGSHSTVGNLSLIREALQQLISRVRHRVHLISGRAEDLPGIKCTTQNWRLETEIADLRQMQIGLSPLPDSPWAKYKFLMKLIQYMALGIVPVATPLGANSQVIRHGENGFLANTTQEWLKYMELLIRDQDLRRRLSYQAAQDAEALYSLRANTNRIIEVFRAAAG